MTFKAILVALALLPRFHEDREAVGKVAQEQAIATAVQKAAKGDADVAAFLLAWGDAETHFSLRIHRGQCFKWECDRGRARGPWQLHRNGMAPELWDKMHGVEHVELQAIEAAKRARWAMRECRVQGLARIFAGFRMLGAKGCDRSLPGEQDRVDAFKRVRARL
jgi:hypothetical protein